MPSPSAFVPPFRLQRSALFVPATSPRFFAKAAASAADGIILDLEDAVSPDKKDEARAAAIAALQEVDWGAKNMAVRINGLESALTYRDVVGLAERCPRLDLIVLPMVNTPDDVRFVSTLLEQIERGLGRTKAVGIEGIIETPLGLENVGDIAASGGRLEALSFGAGDYAVGMKMRNRKIGAADPNYAVVLPGVEGQPPQRHLGDQWHFAMARLANACRAHGLRPRDSAYADFRDLEGYRASCQRAVALGFEGKSCIHPSQVEIANVVFSPSEEEVAWARELLGTMERGMAEGKGAVAVQGEMVDLANIKLAGNILAKAERIAAPAARRGPAPAARTPDLPAPLKGIRVLDIATFIAGPFTAGALGEFGAEVIKIEKPGVGDSLRELGTKSPAGDTYNWLNESRNKKCITLDLRLPRGAELFKRLVATADVVVENFRTGTLEKWGLGYETLREINPGLVMVRITGYGQTGPKRDLPGFARIAHAFCGLTYLTGQPDTPPLMPGSTTLADYLTGIYGAYGVMLALRTREQCGQGQCIDIGLYEPMFRFLDELAPVYAATGHVRERMGADTYNSVPHSHYPTRDGQWVAIACTNDKMFARFCEMMGRPELAHEERFGRKASRMAARAEVNRIVSEWTASLTREEVVARCAEGEVPCGPINSIADIFADAQFAARGDLVRVQDPRAGEVVVPAPMPFLSATPGRLEHLGAALGAHNEEVYRHLLGLSAAELADLQSAGVV